MSPPTYDYDVYISFNAKDDREVMVIAQGLREAGVKVWRWDVVGGDDVYRKIKEALDQSACSAVFVSGWGLGPLQSEEVLVNIRDREERSGGLFRVIPVLLPGAVPDSLPPFLRDRYWVDFRKGLEDEEAFGLLLKSIKDALKADAQTVRGLVLDDDGEEEPTSKGVGPASEVASKHEQRREIVQEQQEQPPGDSAPDTDQFADLNWLVNKFPQRINRMGGREQHAIEIAGTISRITSRPVDSTLFMAALLGDSSDDPNDSGFWFLDYFAKRRTGTGVSSARIAAATFLGLAEYSLSEIPFEPRSDWGQAKVTKEFALFLMRGDKLAERVGDDKIFVRHFIGTALAPSAEGDAPALWRKLEIPDGSLEEYQYQFLIHLGEFYPANLEAWEKLFEFRSVEDGEGEEPSGGTPLPGPPEPLEAEPADALEEDVRESVRRASVSDQPTAHDSLGFAPYVKAVAGCLADENTRPPLTLSIEGEWGSGKSSFMMQLREELRAIAARRRREAVREYVKEFREMEKMFPTPRALTLLNYLPFVTSLRARRMMRRMRRMTRNVRCLAVEFNPWRHDKEDALWASFALEFVRKLSKEMPLGGRVRAHFNLLLRRFKWKDGWLVALRMLFLVLIIAFMLVAFVSLLTAEGLPAWAKSATSDDEGAGLFRVLQASGAAGYVAVILFFLSKFREFVGNPFAFDLRKYVESPDYEGHVAFIEQFHEDFEKVVETYAGKNKVFVFIDDLDRCDVPKAADLMQAINLMVSGEAPQLIFVIGMDREKVAAGLAVKNEKLLPYLAPRRANAQAQPDAQPARAQASQDTGFGIEYGYNFIEKFIQLPFSVPQPAQMAVQDLLDYIAPLVRLTGDDGGAKDKDALKAADGASPEGAGKQESQPRAVDTKREGEPADDAAPDKEKADKEKEVRQAEEILATASPNPRPEASRAETTGVVEGHADKDEAERGPTFTLQDLGDSVGVHNIVLMAAPALDYNPRRIKQYINLFRLKAYIAFETGLLTSPARGRAARLTLEQLGKFVAIGVRWPRLIALLDEERTLLREMQKLATDSAHVSNSQTAREWVQRPELKSLLKFGCEGGPDPFNKERPADARRYTLADLDVDGLLQVSPRPRPLALATTQSAASVNVTSMNLSQTTTVVNVTTAATQQESRTLSPGAESEAEVSRPETAHD